MRLLNIEAFLEREQLMSMGQRGNRRTKVLEFRDAETTAYAILSHRWIDPTEVDCEEIINLAKMDVEEQNEIRGRLGYKKILDTCEQAKRDGYKWVWVDTCCIDTRSSAELSEAINSMYRWYENSRVCYAYLGDVHTSSFPTLCNEAEYPRSNGWPEWFSRGWTLQEMIAPQDVRFFNKNWQPIGDKKTLARTLMLITEVPEHILEKGLSGNRPCVAQIMSWAAHRTTTRIEDRAYSLMGLLDVNMPMLYGEGKKAFHRLQLEIIRMSNDQSIFAWGTGRDKENFGQTGSVLADDPSLFQDCSYIEPMDHNEFIESIGNHVPRGDLVSVDQDCFGTFPITNRGIQIWMLLRPHRGTDSVFQAWLPCRDGSSGPPVTISLALWNSNYYRYSSTGFLPTEQPLEFRQVYLRYQDTCHGITFEIDDNAVTEHFTRCDTYPSKFTGKMLTLTGASRPCVKVYSERQGSGRFAVSFGQCFGQDWLHLINDPSWQYSWPDEGKLMLRGLERAQSMADTPSRAEIYGHIWVHHIRLPGTTWMARASRIVWEKSRVGLRIEVFQKRGSYSGLDEWRILDVERTDDPSRDMRGLMLRDTPCKPERELIVDRVWMGFFMTDKGAKLGDYGHFTDSGHFSCTGNIITDIKSLVSETDILPRQRNVIAGMFDDIVVVDNVGLSLPSNHTFNSSLASLSARLTNAYLVTMVVQCVPKCKFMNMYFVFSV